MTSCSSLFKLFLKFFLLSICVLLIGGSYWFFVKYYYLPKQRMAHLAPLTIEPAIRNQIDPLLLLAVIWQESRFDPLAIGKKNDIGLMQIMQVHSVTDWAKEKNCKIPVAGVLMDPLLNIEIGAWYLAQNRIRYKGYKAQNAMALAAYNAGPGNAAKWFSNSSYYDSELSIIEKIEFPSTKKYVSSILLNYQSYKEQTQ